MKGSGSTEASETVATTTTTTPSKPAASTNGAKKAIHLRLGGFVGKKGSATGTGTSSGTDPKKPAWTHEKVSLLNFIINLSFFLSQFSLKKQNEFADYLFVIKKELVQFIRK